MLKAISFLSALMVAVTLKAQAVQPIYVVHVNLGNSQLVQNVTDEILRPNATFQNRPVVVLRPNLDVADNPFAVSKWGRQTGLTRPADEIKIENTPILSEKMMKWFEELEQKDIHPEIFIINGHHLVGMGFESDDTWETKQKSQFGLNIELSNRSLYMQTIVRSRNYFPVVARFFDRVKLVFIGGCEGLANLEPKENGISGRALTPEEIKNKMSGSQKKLMLEQLREYRDDLVRVYPGSYTAKQEEEICIDSANHLHCEVVNVNRILPDAGLWDGNHLYNMPYQMKRLFPNAYGVFGFNTPSPLSPGNIWKMAFNESRQKLQTENLFQALLSEQTAIYRKKEIVQRIRVSWTKATQLLNGRTRNGKPINRISGSITPTFPDLDQNGIFAYDADAKTFPEAPVYAPYEIRNDVAAPALLPAPLKISVSEVQRILPVQANPALPAAYVAVKKPVPEIKSTVEVKSTVETKFAEKNVEKVVSEMDTPKTLAERIRAIEQAKQTRQSSDPLMQVVEKIESTQK